MLRMAEKSSRMPFRRAYLEVRAVDAGGVHRREALPDGMLAMEHSILPAVDSSSCPITIIALIFVLFIYQKKMHGLSYAATLP